MQKRSWFIWEYSLVRMQFLITCNFLHASAVRLFIVTFLLCRYIKTKITLEGKETTSRGSCDDVFSFSLLRYHDCRYEYYHDYDLVRISEIHRLDHWSGLLFTMLENGMKWKKKKKTRACKQMNEMSNYRPGRLCICASVTWFRMKLLFRIRRVRT